MNKIIVLVGENISDLSFQCGGSNTQGLLVTEGQKPKWIHHIDSTSRKCPEDGKHPKVYQKELATDIEYILPYWHYIVSTNSYNTINIISGLVREDEVHWRDVEIYVLSPDNCEIIAKSGFDSEGYLDYNWPTGFLNIN